MILTKQMIDKPDVADKDLWETPDHIFDKLNEMAGGFTLDPCCTIETAKCQKFYTPIENGLIKSWKGETVFANPPYSRYNIDNWVDKFIDESLTGSIWALLPVSTSADWFQKCIGNTLYFVDKRIKFKNAPYTAPFSSVIIFFNQINRNLTFKQ